MRKLRSYKDYVKFIFNFAYINLYKLSVMLYKMPEILLINPNYMKELYGKRVMSVHPPLGLAYLTSYLNKRGIETEIIDANACNFSEEETIKKIINSDAKIIGIGATSAIAEIAFGLCEKIKERDSSKIIVFGGIHISCLTEESLRKCTAINYAVIGEGEKTLYNLILAIKKKKSLRRVKGIAFIENNKFIKTPVEELIKNLDEIPFPEKKSLPREIYQPGSEFDIGIKGEEYWEIITSRGCPNKCTYCSSSHFWKNIRVRSVENIFQEIKELSEKGVKHLSFLDDTFTISEKRVIELCDRIKSLKLKWDCYARVNNLSEKMVKSMKNAGCLGMRIGFESGSNEILQKIKKNTTIEQAKKAMKIIRKYNLKTFGFFMIGLPGDNRKTIEKTINFAIELEPTFASFAIATPFPGTEMFREYLEKNWVPENFNWHNMDLHDAELTRTDKLSSEEILKYYKNANRRFYIRPKYWIRISIYLVKHPKELMNYSLRMISKLKK